MNQIAADIFLSNFASDTVKEKAVFKRTDHKNRKNIFTEFVTFLRGTEKGCDLLHLIYMFLDTFLSIFLVSLTRKTEKSKLSNDLVEKSAIKCDHVC